MKITNANRGLGLDTASYFTPHASVFFKLGYRTIFRYLNFGKYYRETPCTDSSDWFKSCSKQELMEHTDAGWDVSLVHRRIGARRLSGVADGEKAGAAAAYNAKGIGTPPGATIWCDCEWATGFVPPKHAQIGFIEGRARVLVYEGFKAGLYVSPELDLDSEELYALRWITAYWLSASFTATVDRRGPQVVQSTEMVYNPQNGTIKPWDGQYLPGILRFDADMLCIDGRGDRTKVVSK